MKHSKKVINQMLEEENKRCALAYEGGCAGRLTIDRAVSYAGARIQERWAWLWLCAKHHGVDEFQDNSRKDEAKCRALAIAQATPEELAKYPKLTL